MARRVGRRRCERRLTSAHPPATIRLKTISGGRSPLAHRSPSWLSALAAAKQLLRGWLVHSRVKMQDVAQDAQVSVATVSRVLNGTQRVSDALRARVMASVEKLGYFPNIVAQSLRMHRSFVLGVVIPNISNPHFTDIVRAVEDVALASGYVITACSSDQDLAKEQRYMQVLRDRMADGVLVSVADSQASDVSPLIDSGMPVVLIDRRLEGVSLDSVTVDTKGGAHAAVAYLVGRGYRRIGMIGGPDGVSTAADKLQGYRQALADLNLPKDDSLCLQGDYTEASGYALGCQMLDMADRPDAVLVANGLMTLGFSTAVKQRGLRIPHDMAFIGFDESRWADLLVPPVSRVVQPTYELGQVATEMLLERLEGRYTGKARHRSLPTSLIIRGSC